MQQRSEETRADHGGRTLGIGLPLALVLRGDIAAHLGASLAADAAAEGVNWDWWQDFQQQASGLGATFDPSVIGFASVLRHVSDLLDNADMALEYLAFASRSLLGILEKLAEGSLERFYGCESPPADPESKAEGDLAEAGGALG